MILEFKPRLVDLSKLPKVIPVIKKKFNLNKWILIVFVVFSVFFLFNCRYGIFKCNENNFVLI